MESTLSGAILLIGLLSGLMISSGCASKRDANDEFIESLADTVWAGERREVVLTTGTGGWYYADAGGSNRRRDYGFYLMETKLLADWELRDDTGNDLRENLQYAIVHPEYSIRVYSSGVEERIECLPGYDAIAISYRFKSKTKTIFRCYSPATVGISEASTSNTSSGKFSRESRLLFSHTPFITKSLFTKRVEHPQSALMGETDVSNFGTDSEYSIPALSDWQCVIYPVEDSLKMSQLSKDISKQISLLRNTRRIITWTALAGFSFRCEKKEIEQAYAKARILLAGMYYERDGEGRLFTGFPHSPFMQTFHSSLAGIGLNLADSTHRRSVRLFETALLRQKPVSDSLLPGRLPVAIFDGSADYSTSIAAGAMALTFDRIIANSDSVPLGLPTRFLKALDQAVGAELNSPRHVLGMITGPGLFVNSGFPPRERTGAPFETQALFGVARNYLLANQAASGAGLEVPETALKGERDWRYPYIPEIAVGSGGKQYQVPLSIEATLSRFRSRDGRWFDRLLIPETADQDLLTPSMVSNPPIDSTKSVVPLLAVHWLEKNDRRTAERLMTIAEMNGLIGEVGFRSLGDKESEFQSSHVFVLDDEPVNATLSGDMLVWTAGILADLNTTAESFNANVALFEQLSRLALEEGIIGGLPEAVNGVLDAKIDNTARNPLFASSLAEYVRILYDDFLGIDTKRAVYPGVRLMVPKEWGKIEFSFQNRETTITVKRIEANLWTAEQTGSEDRLPLEVELWLEEGVHGYGSVTLNPNKVAKFKIVPTKVNYWTLAWDEFPRER